MKILVINCGSSSIKYNLFDMTDESLLAKGAVERIGEEQSYFKQSVNDDTVELKTKIANHEEGLKIIVENLVGRAIADTSEISAVGHRVVHGGEAFVTSTLIDDRVIATLEEFIPLAPLHNPPNLTGINAAKSFFKGAPHVAVFDTAFHQSIPPKAYMYAIPYELYKDLKVRKYGFHGTSHLFVSEQAAAIVGIPREQLNAITCHLGNGASMAAIENGKSVDTSMGLTPLEGLIMGTRCGDIDPAIIFYLARRTDMSIDEIDSVLNKESGLLGISQVTNDFRELEKAIAAGNKHAKLAFEMFCYRIRKYIGAYMAVLRGCEVIIFTGGIGEHQHECRQRVLEGLDHLGIIIDEKANVEFNHKGGTISTAGSKVKVMVIPTNEELLIARDTYALVK